MDLCLITIFLGEASEKNEGFCETQKLGRKQCIDS